MAHSKSRVDRAGKQAAERLQAIIDGEPFLEQHGIEFAEAIEVIEWWRSEHAKPLSQVAANLRHYAGEQGKPIVAQRLKKTPTISSKLVREPRSTLLMRLNDS